MLKINRINNSKIHFCTKIYLFILPIILLLSSNVADAAIKEGRAVWVTRGTFTPQQYIGNYSQQKAIIREIMKDVANANMNVVIFQVRGMADAYYNSTLEPWANRLTGRLGNDPGYDPLEYAIKEAHARGLKLHAWINVFPCWNGNSPPSHRNCVFHPSHFRP